jgi:hypothetical protein
MGKDLCKIGATFFWKLIQVVIFWVVMLFRDVVMWYPYYITTWRHKPENREWNLHRRENHKSRF